MELIDRGAAIDAFNTGLNELVVDGEENAKTVENYLNRVIEKIKCLPSAQLGTNLAEVGTDCISRQSAIDALTEYGNGRATYISVGEAVIRMEQLPSAVNVPETNVGKMVDTISRNQAIDAIRAMQTYKLFAGDDTLLIDQAGAQTELMLLPPAQPKKGRWISADATFGREPFYCSKCGENTWDTVMGKPRWNFCPNCGADMR